LMLYDLNDGNFDTVYLVVGGYFFNCSLM
jgi:hypothetical protein